MAVEDDIYTRLMDWSKEIYNNPSDTTTFEYEVQHQGLGELVQSMMAEAWDDGHEVGHRFDIYEDVVPNPYRQANR